MKFEAIKRDCNTRTGYLEIEKNKKIRIPNIFWYSSLRIPPPSFAEIKLKAGSFFYPNNDSFSLPPALVYPYFFPEKLHEKAFEVSKSNEIFSIIFPKIESVKKSLIYVMANTKELFQNPRNFVESIINIRKKIGYSLLYAPGIANPINLPILCYLGIDLFDSLDIIVKTRKKIYFTSCKEYNLEEIEEYPCSCNFCKKGIKNYEDLLMHNYEIMKNELVKTIKAIESNRLREIVEAKSHLNANYASMIRILDVEHYEYQEKRYPIIGNKIIASPYSIYRPDIVRFRKRVIERYEKPASAKILLLLPCSAKKPYSTSKSHKIFNRVIANSPNRHIIHEVIITSPIGIVPRELEYIYPAAHYDISVIGYWDKEEIHMVNYCLSKYLEKNKYDVIINHLPKEITLDIDAIETCIEHPTSDDSIKELAKALEITENYEKISHTKRRYENARSMLLYQFGQVAKNFIEGCKIKGKFPDYKIYYEDKQLAMFSQKRGMFVLTFAGGKKLGKNYWVEIDDFIPKGSIFAIGIKNADEKIRIGDEVVIFYNDELRGVGVAKMNAEEMVEANAGEAVKVRHYKS